MKKRLGIYLSILVFVTFLGLKSVSLPTAAAPNASLDLIGTRLLRDVDFYGNRDWTNTKELPRQDIGGRLQVYVRNTGAAPVTLTGFTLGGKSFDELTTHATSRVEDTKWWRMWPNPVPPGEVAMLNMRLIDLAVDLPDGAALVLQTDEGDVTLPSFAPAPSDLWIPSLNFTEDLRKVVLFVGNRGQTDITLKATGGLRIDGGAELITGAVADTALAPGEVVPVTVEVAVGTLVTGTQTVFQVTAQSGEVAFGSVRVFPYHFTVMAHMQGGNYDEADRAAHYVGDWDWWTPEILDEPHGHSVAPMEVVQRVDDWLSDPDHPERATDNPTTIHNTSYLEGLVYDDIADIANSHWGNVRQDLAAYVTQPKANWYMPQNSWGHNEGLYRRESWSGLEDLQFQAFQAAGRGAKAIQWFLYQNHWRQGWGRMEGTDFARIYQDKYRTGHIGNPLTWHRIGRVSGALHVIEPYLTHSAHATGVLTRGLQIDVLISSPVDGGGWVGDSSSPVDGGGPVAVATVMDYATPRNEHAGYAFRYGVPDYAQQRRYNVPVNIPLSDYLYDTVTHAYVVDPWLGVQELSLDKSSSSDGGGGWVGVTLPELNVGALVVLGGADDGALLNARWAEVAPYFAAYGDAKPAVLSRAREHPAAPWRASDTVYRQTVTVTNTGSSPATTFALHLDLPQEREFTQESYRVYELSNDTATAVPFYAVGTEVYADFTDPDNYERMKWGGQGGADESLFTVTQTITGVHLLSKKLLSTQQVWNASFWDYLGPLPWMNEHPSYWIPARYGSLWVDVNPTQFPFGYYNYRLVIYWDVDEDGTLDKSRAFTFAPEGLPTGEWSDWIWYDLGAGWRRYVFDMDQVFNTLFAGDPAALAQGPHGQYRPAYMTLVPTGYEHLIDADKFWSWSLRQVKAVGGAEVTVQPPTPLAVGESRTYEIYLDVVGNGPDTPSAQLDPTLAGADLAPDLTAATGALEVAGVDVLFDGTKLTITAQAETNMGILRHLGTDFVATQNFASLPAVVTLTHPLQAGDLLAVIPVQRGSEGETFVFNAYGQPVAGHAPAADIVPDVWRTVIEAGQYEVTRTIPYALDLSPNGQYVAVGASIVTYDLDQVSDPPVSNEGRVWLFDASGTQVWEKTFPGRPFHVKFTPDSQALYVAANLSADGITHSGDWNFPLYEDSHILKYDLTGGEQWRHKIASGISEVPAGEQGRTVFDMQVYPAGPAAGDVLYSEWHAYAARLDSATGNVVWAQDTGFGTSTYTPRVVPLADGGGVLLGFYSRRVDANGDVVASVFMSNESHHALGASLDGGTWALSGNSVRVITRTGEFRITPGGPQEHIGPGATVGRYPRVIRVSDDGNYVAAGSTDGVFALLDGDGNTLWEKQDAASYVTDIHFLPGGQGVALMREIFNYRHANRADRDGWRWRDVVEAYTLEGTPLWRHEGRWREEEPGMGQFVLSAAGSRMAVLTNGDARYVDLTAEAISNRTLYPVDDYGDSGPTPFMLGITPEFQTIVPGGTARYQLTLDPQVAYPITFTITNPVPDALEITPVGSTLVLPEFLRARDIHSPTSAIPARMYTIPITATGGGFTRTAQARLRVGGVRVYLPLVVRQ